MTLVLGLTTYVCYGLLLSFLYRNYIVPSNLVGGGFTIANVNPVVWCLAAGIIAWVLPMLLNLKRLLVVTPVAMLSAAFYFPVRHIVLPIYAFANFDDVSWGNSSDAADKDNFRRAKTNEFRLFKSQQLAIWVVTNLFVAYSLCFSLTLSDDTLRKAYIIGLSFLGAALLLFKGIFAALYQTREFIMNYICCCLKGCCRKRKKEQVRRPAAKSNPLIGASNPSLNRPERT
eukprot:TRINITY_DN13591_c0_g1_i2.p1 TRINITY_DN13591_c0_g1~~TRINITY_DN13591_c0_g1_i2.p1  ORF type:complete len:230 (-),score=33.20 TRINITY_DN13591_c0_g1_i2:152-841(-)